MVAEVNRRLEEENVDGPLPEQWLRLRQRSAKFAGKTREVHISYYAKDAATKEWKAQSETVTF